MQFIELLQHLANASIEVLRHGGHHGAIALAAFTGVHACVFLERGGQCLRLIMHSVIAKLEIKRMTALYLRIHESLRPPRDAK